MIRCECGPSEEADIAECIAALGFNVQRLGARLVCERLGCALPTLVIDLGTNEWHIEGDVHQRRPLSDLVAAIDHGSKPMAWPCDGFSRELRFVLRLVALSRGSAVSVEVERVMRTTLAAELCVEPDGAASINVWLWAGSLPPPL